MPTYEYACRECGEHTEVQQSFSDPALTECPACGGPLRKVFGNIAITFKGSGFYKTDSRASNGKGKAAAKTGGGSPSGSESTTSESSKSESSKSESSKSESSKSESSKSESSGAKPEKSTPAAAAS